MWKSNQSVWRLVFIEWISSKDNMVGSSVFHIFLNDVNNIELKRNKRNREPRAEHELDNYYRFFLYYIKCELHFYLLHVFTDISVLILGPICHRGRNLPLTLMLVTACSKYQWQGDKRLPGHNNTLTRLESGQHIQQPQRDQTGLTSAQSECVIMDS